MTDGKRVEVTGCDLFTFKNGKIALKNSYPQEPPADRRVTQRDARAALR